MSGSNQETEFDMLMRVNARKNRIGLEAEGAKIRKDEGTVCVLGMGYVGLTFATHMALKGARVLGLEVRPEIAKQIMAGKPHFFENGLEEKLTRVLEDGSITVQQELYPQQKIDTLVISLGTPLIGRNPSMDLIDRSVVGLIDNLQSDALVIIRSTVSVGTTRQIANLVRSHKPGAFIACCPERTVEGKALEEIPNLPQIVGGIDKQSTERAADFFESVGVKKTVTCSNPEEAELAKLAANAYRDVVFGFANELASIAGKLGVSARNVIESTNYEYPRANIPIPGLVGGACLEKDSWILLSGQDAGLDSPIRAAREQNLSVVDKAIERMMSMFFDTRDSQLEVKIIAIIGLAFKGEPKTSDVRGSMAFDIVSALRLRFPNSFIYGADDLVSQTDALKLGLDAKLPPEDLASKANIIVFQNKNELQASRVLPFIQEHARVLDFWGHDSIRSARNFRKLVWG